MITDDNKAIYRRFVQETFNEGRLDRLDYFVAPDFVARNGAPGMPSGADGVRYVITIFRTAFPDLRVSLEEVVGERDFVCVRSTLRGTHQGSLFGIPPTGRSVAMSSLEMVRIRDGRLAESWVQSDVAGLMSQLGVTPAPSAA